MLDGSAASINILGQVVGSASEFPPGGPEHAFLWTSADGMQLLSNLPGFHYSSAYGMVCKSTQAESQLEGPTAPLCARCHEIICIEKAVADQQNTYRKTNG
jgi:hypothetical protein